MSYYLIYKTFPKIQNYNERRKAEGIFLSEETVFYPDCIDSYSTLQIRKTYKPIPNKFQFTV